MDGYITGKFFVDSVPLFSLAWIQRLTRALFEVLDHRVSGRAGG